MPSIQKHKKRSLTQGEKTQIRTFYRNNPLVTHSHVARVFGLERSTVSKILGSTSCSEQSSYESQPSPASLQTSASVSPTLAPVPESADLLGGQVDQSTIMRALTRWARQKQEQGVRVTQQMIRQEAAALSTINLPQLQFVSATDTSLSPVAPAATNSWPPLPQKHEPFDSQLSDSDFLTASLLDDPNPFAAPSNQVSTSFPDLFASLPESTLQFPALAPCDSSPSQSTACVPASEPDLLGALDQLSGHLSADKPLSSLDAVCVEHLRERILQLRRDSATASDLDFARTLPSLAALMQDQQFW